MLTELDSLDVLKQWMESTILDGIFVDPTCGDGLCEQPQEVRAFSEPERFDAASLTRRFAPR